MEPIYQRPTDNPENRANDSISSASSNDSQGFTTCKKTTSISGLSKQSSQVKVEKKREKRWKKNKIGKEDFFNKTTEFRTWLEEKKNIQFDSMSTPKAKKAFKKFIKKWNNKKLDQKYYSGLGVYWAAASPSAYSHADVPVLSPSRAEAKLKASSFTPLYLQDFSTFGKKEGKKALEELKRMEGFGTPSRPEEHVYDVPHSGCSSYNQGVQPGYTSLRKGSTIKPRPALAELFQRPGEVATPRLESGEEPVFANISRHRPVSCHGRVQKPAATPCLPAGPHGDGNDDSSVKLRPPTSRPPRPHTEYHSTHTSFGFMRKKPRSTISTSSTDSDVSSISSSTTSTKSSLSSLSSAADRQSIVSEAEYVCFGPKPSTEEATGGKSGEYVSFQPKPPPRSSSIGSRSQQLRQVAQVVVDKISATPAKEMPMQMKSMTPGKTLEAPMGDLPEKPSKMASLPPPLPKSAPPYSPDNHSQEMREVAKKVLARVGVTPTNSPIPTKVLTPGKILQVPVCTNDSTPPPPPPPLTSFTPLNESSDKSLPLPPPEFDTGEIATGSPAFPPPPSPLDSTQVDSESKAGEMGQKAAQIESTPKSIKPPRPQLAKKVALEKKQLPTSQESAVPQVTQDAVSSTRRHVMTPRHALTPGPLLSRHVQPTPCTKLQKRPSSEALDSYDGVTPAKKMDLDISYKSTFV